MPKTNLLILNGILGFSQGRYRENQITSTPPTAYPSACSYGLSTQPWIKNGACVAHDFIMTGNKIGESKLEMDTHFPIWPPPSAIGCRVRGAKIFAVIETDSSAMLLPTNCD